MPNNFEELCLELPEKFQAFFYPHRHKVAWGGRGSAKSWSISEILLLIGAVARVRILCAREFQNSIKDSVHKLLCDTIDRYPAFAPKYKIQDVYLQSTTGSEIIFAGLHNNVNAIRSKEGVNIVWVEEGENVSKFSWEILTPTIRTPWFMPLSLVPQDLWTPAVVDAGGMTYNSEIWCSYNPEEETAETHQRYRVKTPPPNALIIEMNWRDNPWLPPELEEDKNWLAATDPDAYQHVWEGQCRKSSAAQVLFGKYKIEAFDPEEDWDGPYDGMDFGFSVDPSAYTRAWIHNNRLYIEHEAYGHRIETDDLPGLIGRVPDATKYVSRADSSRPETISYCRRHGFPRMVGVEKWPGNKEDGINYLRGEFVEIVIHPRCKHVAEEARLWSYKVDKNSGDPLPLLEDKNDHCWDAILYSIAPLIKNGVKLVKKLWRFWTDRKAVEDAGTIKLIVLATDDVQESSAELAGVMQCWNVGGYSAMYLVEELPFWGTWPEWLATIETFWGTHQELALKASELWVDNKSMGQSMIRFLRRKGLPAREWNPRPAAGVVSTQDGIAAPDRKDELATDVSYRAKQAAIHLSEGRIFVPEGAAVVTDIDGLSTEALTLAVAIWAQRGGGQGEVPEVK